MERGIYCHNWGHNRQNMHPSMPIHSKALVEDFKKLKGTMVCWASMGGGSVSLPYLEHEAKGEVHPRMLYHGYMNDSDYIAMCREAGIDVFAVFYEAQGWEVPAIVSEDGKYFKKLNIVEDDEEHDWYGLREFSQDKYWEVFGKKFADYFPDGLVNSDGEQVTDLFEECTTRDMYGNPCRATWVEVSKLPQQCHLTCRNNPVWRQYMKKAVEIMIDNGARGIQLDETETPITSLKYGGCFCKDCMKQFNEYLKEMKSLDRLPKELDGIDLDRFNYAQYLKDKGVNYPERALAETPLFDLYWDFWIRSNNKNFKDVTQFIREYAASKGIKVRISANIFNLYLYNYPSWDDLDLMVTELDHTLFKRHDWFRYAAGVVKDKPVIVAENPYGGIIPAFLKQLQNGKAYDLFRIFLMEAAIHGINMCVPYGGWMGSEIRDAFFPPFDVAVEVQDFLAGNEPIFGRISGANVKILYSFPSYTLREPMAGRDSKLVWDDSEDLFSYRIETSGDNAIRMPYWEAASVLQMLKVNYDAGMLSDGEIVPDKFSNNDLKGFDLVILPDCTILTKNQADILKDYAQKGGRLLIYGDSGRNISGWQQSLKGIPSINFVDKGNSPEAGAKAFSDAFNNAYNGLRQISWEPDDIFVQISKYENNTVLHVINYRYDMAKDRIISIQKPVIKIKRNTLPKSVKALTLQDTTVDCTCRLEDGWLLVEIGELPVYTAVILEDLSN